MTSQNLTPLHFIRKPKVQGGGPRYGVPSYVTDCGRFLIKRSRWTKMWTVGVRPGSNSLMKYWFFLNETGLMDAEFPTRQATLTALAEMLDAEATGFDA